MSTPHEIYDQPRRDVLVVGGGLAGMYAAIEADRCGRRVLLISKGRTGSSGNSLVAMSVHRFAPREAGLREDYRARFLASGGGLQNPALAELMIREGADAVENLKNYGLPLEYRYADTPSGPAAYLACCSPKNGRYLTLPLRRYLEEHTQVSVQDGVMAFELVVSDGRVTGVLAERNGDVCYYPANTVVLATGGCGNLYQYTSNTSDLTGDGYAMATRSGIALTGMEFVQFYPYRIYAPRRADIFPDIFSHGAVYRNELGQRFMDGWPKKEQENRDILARAIYRQKQVTLDLSACDHDYLERECPNIAKMERDFPGQPMVVRPVAHYFMGGIPISADCSTPLPGLLACGETAGGVHGANRLAGSGLTETAVFGRIAGRQAGALPETPRDAAAEHAAAQAAMARICAGWQERRTMPDRTLLREIAWKYASVERTVEGLRTMERLLDEMDQALRVCRPEDLHRWLELRDLISVGRSVASAAAARPESLGAHFIRKDA